MFCEALAGEARAGHAGTGLAGKFAMIQERQIGGSATIKGGDSSDAAGGIGATTQFCAGEPCDLADADLLDALKKGPRAHATPIVPRPPAQLRTLFHR
jgi:hypothetical protein